MNAWGTHLFRSQDPLITAAQAASDIFDAALSLNQRAGLPAVREALADVMESDLPVIELEGQVKIRIAHPPVEVRYAGGGLESFIFEYRGRQHKGLIARAVLAFQRANGSSIPPLPALKVGRRSARPLALHEQPATRRG